MKTSIKACLSVLPILFIGCGGGGGGGSPAPSPQVSIPNPNPVVVPPVVPVVPTNYVTQEYLNSKLNRIDAAGAYNAGYTGLGVTVAVLDSGVDYKHVDLDANVLQGRSFAAYHYEPISGNLFYTNGGISSDQIESIQTSSLGTTYTIAPTVTISGDGTGATAEAVLNNDGTISGIYMTNHGSGYTTATVTVNETGTGGTGLTVSKIRLGAEDNDGHGTAVSGVIAAEKTQLTPESPANFGIQGIAFKSKILPIKVLDGGSGSSGRIEEGIRYAADNGAKVINMSLGSSTSAGINTSSYNYALNLNSTIVVSAGNSGLACLPVSGSLEGQCNFPAALPWLSGNESMLTQAGGWIVVGSVDSNNIISSFSNKAGVTKSNYLMAPGEAIQSTYKDGMGVMTSGTSIAAPYVSGAMALMYEKYPFLNGKQLSEIFFSTATDLGAAGVDDIYGNGLINVGKAFSPIGQLMIPNTTTVIPTTGRATSGGIVFSQAFGSVDLKELSTTIAIDNYGRDFKINMDKAVSIDSKKTFSFDNFATMSYGNFLFGADQQSQKPMIGYASNNFMIRASFSDDLFGVTSSGATGIGEARTIYTSMSKRFNVSEEVVAGMALDYGYGSAKSDSNSLISDISALHAFGGSVFAEYNAFGLRYEQPLSIQKGSLEMTIPTSRDISGNITYDKITKNMSVSDKEERFGLYYRMFGETLNGIISYDFIKNQYNIKSSDFTSELKVAMNYYF